MSIEHTVAKLDRQARNETLSEDSLALGFCQTNPDLRYIATWNRWMSWSGSVWSEDQTLSVYDRIRAYVRRATDADADWMKASAIAAIERMTKADRRYAATADQWDQLDFVLNTPGGTVDLTTGTVLPSIPENYLTKSTTIAPGGDCPTWQRFLDQVTAGDVEYIGFLQRVAGYASTGSTREHALFFLYGSGGNGKGTFLNTLQRVLGDYATVSDMTTFTESHSDRHPTDLAFLRGARLVFAQETEEGRAWAESRIKALTGGDPITARYMRQDFFTFQPKFKLLIAGNHKPRLRNVDEAMRRRLHLLPFTVAFKGDQRDPDLAEKLLAEAGGILEWIIHGALAYQTQGLKPPPVVAAATAEYFASEDIFDQWLHDAIEIDPNAWETPARLFACWKRYTEQANEVTGTQKALGEHLTNAGFAKGNSRSKGGRFWDGLRVRDVARDHHEDWQD